MIREVDLTNLGTGNKNKVMITTDKGIFNLYFSYRTLVGIEYNFCENKKGKALSWAKKKTLQNYWSTTTGKLLNELEPDKKARITREQFDNEVSEMMSFIDA